MNDLIRVSSSALTDLCPVWGGDRRNGVLRATHPLPCCSFTSLLISPSLTPLSPSPISNVGCHRFSIFTLLHIHAQHHLTSLVAASGHQHRCTPTAALQGLHTRHRQLYSAGNRLQVPMKITTTISGSSIRTLSTTRIHPHLQEIHQDEECLLCSLR